MVKKEELANLVKRKKRASKIAGSCIFFVGICLMVSLLTLIIQKQPTILTGIFILSAIIVLIVYFIFATIETKRRHEQIDLVSDYIERLMLEVGLSEKEFEIESVFETHYKVYMETLQVDYQELIRTIKQKLKWIEDIYKEKIKITLVYFIESE